MSIDIKDMPQIPADAFSTAEAPAVNDIEYAAAEQAAKTRRTAFPFIRTSSRNPSPSRDVPSTSSPSISAA